MSLEVDILSGSGGAVANKMIFGLSFSYPSIVRFALGIKAYNGATIYLMVLQNKFEKIYQFCIIIILSDLKLHVYCFYYCL